MLKNNSKVTLVGILTVWLCTVVVWLAYRLFFKNSELIEEVVLKPLVFIVPVIWYLWQRNVLTTENLGFRKVATKNVVIWGGLFSLFLASENIFFSLSRGVPLIANRFTFGVLGTNLIVSTATAVSEEILYRGFLMENIWKITGNEVVANAASTFLFMIGHVGVAIFGFGYRGWDLGHFLLLMFVVGFTQGFIYGRTRSISASVPAHAIWNFVSAILR